MYSGALPSDVERLILSTISTDKMVTRLVCKKWRNLAVWCTAEFKYDMHSKRATISELSTVLRERLEPSFVMMECWYKDHGLERETPDNEMYLEMHYEPSKYEVKYDIERYTYTCTVAILNPLTLTLDLIILYDLSNDVYEIKTITRTLTDVDDGIREIVAILEQNKGSDGEYLLGYTRKKDPFLSEYIVNKRLVPIVSNKPLVDYVPNELLSRKTIVDTSSHLSYQKMYLISLGVITGEHTADEISMKNLDRVVEYMEESLDSLL